MKPLWFFIKGRGPRQPGDKGFDPTLITSHAYEGDGQWTVGLPPGYAAPTAKADRRDDAATLIDTTTTEAA